MDDLLRASATELADLIRTREVSAHRVVDTHIRRVEQVNPKINAVVADRFDQALDEARAVDARLAKKKSAPTPPLLGVPCTIKEFFAVREMPWTGGMQARAHVRADRDATTVARLREAGAIVIGVTNAPEGGLWHETNNTIYGRTSNPWDLHRTPGGSSGGEGAIIAAGGSPFGMGSDTGGSIRIPSAMCGIAGHKPTGGLVPATGHFPDAPSGEIPIMSCGPMSRDARDLYPLLALIAGPDGVDPQATRPLPPDPATVDVAGLTVFGIETNGRALVRARVRQGVRDATDALVDRGATRGSMRVPELAQAFEVWGAVLAGAHDRYDVIVGGGEAISWIREVAKYPIGRSNHTASVLLILGLEKLLDRLPGQTEHLRHVGEQMLIGLEEGLGPNGVLIHPVYARTAPRHRGMLVASPFDVSLTTAFNITGMPSTVVPVGRDDRGLPVAVQIVARRGNDHLTLAAAVAVQEAFGRLGPVDPSFGPRAPLGIRLARDVDHG